MQARAASDVDAGGGGDRDREGVNHFVRLPDELVRRIFSELEATEAYEECRLWAVDRRFSQLMRGVQWQQLWLPCSRNRYQFDQHDIDSLERTNNYRAQLDRFTARVQSGALAGSSQLVVGPAWVDRGAYTAGRSDIDRALSTKEGLEACIYATYSLSALMKAMSTAPVPLEAVCLTGNWQPWPLEAKQRELGIAAPRSLEDVARSFLAALCPAPLRSLQLDDWRFSSTLVAVATPRCFENLRELRLENGALILKAEHTSKLVQMAPGLKTLSCSVHDGAALQHLLKLPLENLQVLRVTSNDGLEGVLEAPAFNANYLRVLFLSPREPVTPRILAAILRLRNLEELWIAVESLSTSCDMLGGLRSLEKLRYLGLQLYIDRDEDKNTRLMQATAAALPTAPSSLEFALSVSSDIRIEPRANPAILASLISASRPILKELKINCGMIFEAQVLQEIAQAGPKLQSVDLYYRSGVNVSSIDKLQELSALRNISNDHLPNLRIDLKVVSPNPVFSNQAFALLSDWFGDMAPPIFAHVNSEEVFNTSS